MAFFKSDTGNIIADYQSAPVRPPSEDLIDRASRICDIGDRIIDASGHDDSCSHAFITEFGRCFTSNFYDLHPEKSYIVSSENRIALKPKEELPLFVKTWEALPVVGSQTWVEIDVSQLKNPIRVFCYMGYLVIMTKEGDLFFTGACADNVSYGSFSKIGSNVVDVVYPINEGVLFWCKSGEIWMMRRDSTTFSKAIDDSSTCIKGSPERMKKLEQAISNRPIKFLRASSRNIFVKFKEEERILVYNHRDDRMHYLSDLINVPKEKILDIGACKYGEETYYLLTESGRCFCVESQRNSPKKITEIVIPGQSFEKIYKLRDEVYLFTNDDMFWKSNIGFDNKYCYPEKNSGFSLFNKEWLINGTRPFGKVVHVFGMPEFEEGSFDQLRKKQKQ